MWMRLRRRTKPSARPSSWWPRLKQMLRWRFVTSLSSKMTLRANTRAHSGVVADEVQTRDGDVVRPRVDVEPPLDGRPFAGVAREHEPRPLGATVADVDPFLVPARTQATSLAWPEFVDQALGAAIRVLRGARGLVGTVRSRDAGARHGRGPAGRLARRGGLIRTRRARARRAPCRGRPPLPVVHPTWSACVRALNHPYEVSETPVAAMRGSASAREAIPW